MDEEEACVPTSPKPWESSPFLIPSYALFISAGRKLGSGSCKGL